jgi:hypothetical protein
MSLINDAIKRANQTVTQRHTPVEGIRLKPVDTPRRPNVMPLILIPLVLVVLLAAGGWLLWKGLPWGKKNTPETPALARTALTSNAAPASTRSSTPPATGLASTPSAVAQTKPTNTPAVATSSIPSVTEAPKPPPSVAPKPKPTATTPPPVVAIAPPPLMETKPPAKTTTAPANVTSSSPPAGPPPEFPVLKLQGIYFRRANPSALINGETVFVGDVVKGVKVMAIERSAVTLELNGFKKIITFQ